MQNNNEALQKAVQELNAQAQTSKPKRKPKAPGPKEDALDQSKRGIQEGQYTDEWLAQELEDAGVEVFYTDQKNGYKFFYVACPNEAQHSGQTLRGDAKVYIYKGYPVFKCHHAHCTCWKFADFAQARGIDFRKKTGRAPDKDTHYFSDFYEWRDYQDGTSRPTKIIDVNICDWICKNYEFFIMGDLPYFLNDSNRYELDEGGARMKRLIQSCIVPRLCKDSAVTGVYRMILYQDKRKTYDELNQYPVEYVPFRNGFFDPINNRMLPITPEHYVINQIPHEYHPEADCPSPIFDELLKFQLQAEDARELWLEYCGTCFNRDTSGQKWMIIRGGGGTGKSTELNALSFCIGDENISNETLQGLNERFNATALFGKLVNICADISSEDMKKIDVLKKITGEDRNGVKHERKGKDSFFFTPFAKLLFSANEIPLNRDEKTNAFYRRLLITVMDRKPENIDRNLSKKLREETPGIIHRYMEALRRFYARGGYYIESEQSIHEVKRLRRSADSIVSFIDDELIEDPAGRIERGALYDAYCAYCKREERLHPVTRNRMFDRLRDEGYQETKSNGVRNFVGLRFQDKPAQSNSIWQKTVDDDEEIPFT